MRSLLFLVLPAGLLLFFRAFGQAQQPGGENIFSILQRYESLKISIETDLKQLKNDKADEQWQTGVFKIMKGDSAIWQRNIWLAARGNMRKKTCAFPPVKIRFYDQKPENDSLADINELKLVTTCHYSDLYEEWVRREYLLYELYNRITEQSFRVKPAEVRFETPGKRSGAVESFSFFIESEQEMAARIGGKPVKPRVGSTRMLDSTSYDRMCVFQYMIGNTDWSVRSRHNIKLIYIIQNNAYIAVPYDFDYAGAVGAEYAIPGSDLPIQTVQDRYYLGLCRSAAHYQKIFDFILSKKQALLEHCERSPILPKGAGKQMVNYFKGFFEVLESPSLARREIIQNCNKGR